MKKVGMHVHSSVSDGKDRPSVLIGKASQDGLSAVCLTDHDLYHGIDEFRTEAKKYDIKTIPAMEVSAHWQNRSYVHLLAYGIDFPGKELFLREKLVKNWEAHNGMHDEIMKRLVECYSVHFFSRNNHKRDWPVGASQFCLADHKVSGRLSWHR